MKQYKSAKAARRRTNVIVHIVLAILAVIWIFPVLWVIMTSFRAEKGSYVSTFFPQGLTLDNYTRLFTDTAAPYFPPVFMETLIIAVFAFLLPSVSVVSASHLLFRMRV